MLTIELINTNIPRLQLQDSVSKALQLMNDFRLTHLPVVADNKYLGLVSEEDLLDAAWGLEANSRLSCQVKLGKENITIEIPKYTINHARENH